jgi:hypothetical protein
LDTVIHNEIRHQSRQIDIADTFVQRPTSIGNLWLDVLNLQKVNLFLSFKSQQVEQVTLIS